MVEAAPDVVLVTNITVQQLGGVEKLWALPGMSLTPAARDKKIIIMDAQSLLSFGPRIFQIAADLHLQLKEKMAVVATHNPALAKHE
jgi:iron complex transport system substrate-binding protein